MILKESSLLLCVEPEQDFIKFRAMNPIRTKGSVIITFNLFGTSFMIINSHFEGLLKIVFLRKLSSVRFIQLVMMSRVDPIDD